MFNALGHAVGQAHALQSLGSIDRDRGDTARARRHLEQSLALWRGVGHTHGESEALAGLGDLARDEGAGERAEALYESSLALCREMAYARGLARALHGLGLLARDRRDDGAAWRLLAESLTLQQRIRSRLGIARTLVAMADLAANSGDTILAARWIGAADTVCEQLGIPLPPAERIDHQRRVDGVRQRLGEERFVQASRDGTLMPLAGIVQEARARAEERSSNLGVDRRARPDGSST
jgi:hypothetical protein